MSLFNAVNVDGNIISNTFSGIGSLLKNIRTAITGKVDPDKLAEIEKQTLEIENGIMMAQVEINKIEASNPSVFVSGWRPFVGWICGAGFCYSFLLFPLLTWASRIANIAPPPQIDYTSLRDLLIAMLGMGTLRTFEKIKKIARD